MKKLIARLLDKYGVDICLRRFDGDTVIRGFMQHTRSLGWKNMQPVYSPLGEVPRGQYRLILPAEPELRREDVICIGEHWYTVRRTEKVWFRSEVIYSWCLCEERGEPDNWGFQ